MHWIENIQCDDNGAIIAVNATNDDNGYRENNSESEKKHTQREFASTHKLRWAESLEKHGKMTHSRSAKKREANRRSEYSVLKCVCAGIKMNGKIVVRLMKYFIISTWATKYNVHNDGVNTTHFIPDVLDRLPWHGSAGCSNEMRHANKHINDKCDFSIQWTHFHPISLSLCSCTKTHL